MTASAYDISKSDLSDSESEIESSVLQKARDMVRLLYHMKEKLSDSTLKMSTKIQILTIAPESWSKLKSLASSMFLSIWYGKLVRLQRVKEFLSHLIKKKVGLYQMM